MAVFASVSALVPNPSGLILAGLALVNLLLAVIFWFSRGSRQGLSHWRQWRPLVGGSALALFGSVYFTLAGNRLFWQAAMAGRDGGQWSTWGFAIALFVFLSAIHFVLLAPLMGRRTAKPVLALLLVVVGCASFYMEKYGIYLDPSMLRNVLKTDVKEAGDLLTWSLVPHLALVVGLPLLLLSRVHLPETGLGRTLAIRTGFLLLALVLGGGAVFLESQDFASLMRNHKEIRYLITPANLVYSLSRVAKAEAAQGPRQPIGTDAALAAAWKGRSKPALFVIVVGETARAANWGLNGYERQTTPELARLDVINFPQVSSCGTNTEVSVPCIFAPVGRRDYDEEKIRGSESLLHVLDRAGFKVLWRDNQSGCKGVCEGLPTDSLTNAAIPGLCDGERCLDEVLLHNLDKVLADDKGNRVLVLHQLGNHGPAYHKRYPEAFHRYAPTCDSSDLRQCSREQIVNSYDNALLYTDHVLAKTIDFLKSQDKDYDTGLMYFSDHGESLGENNLFLHGMPYGIAPQEQTRVPMVMWLSRGFAQDFKVNVSCLKARAAQPASHDNIFHSVLGLLDVSTSIYDAKLDLAAGCRS